MVSYNGALDLDSSCLCISSSSPLIQIAEPPPIARLIGTNDRNTEGRADVPGCGDIRNDLGVPTSFLLVGLPVACNPTTARQLAVAHRAQRLPPDE